MCEWVNEGMSTWLIERGTKGMLDGGKRRRNELFNINIVIILINEGNRFL